MGDKITITYVNSKKSIKLGKKLDKNETVGEYNDYVKKNITIEKYHKNTIQRKIIQR